MPGSGAAPVPPAALLLAGVWDGPGLRGPALPDPRGFACDPLCSGPQEMLALTAPDSMRGLSPAPTSQPRADLL